MRNFLLTDQLLRTNEYIVAPNGSCFAIMQADGNFCLYLGSGPAARGKCIWCALSQSRPHADYYAVMQGDGNLVVYQGIPGDASEFVWATGTQAAGRKFIAAVENGVNFTVSAGVPEEPAKQHVLWAAHRRLRVLTYNTHLIEGSNIEVGAWWDNQKPVVFQDDIRHGFLVEKIKRSGADIVALQEVWSENRMDKIRQDLRDIYPYSVRGTSGPATKAGSGIVLVSKYPLENGKFVEYTSGAEPSEEKWATKGMLGDTVVLGPGAKLRVGSTHMWTNAGGPDCNNVSDLIRETGENQIPALLLGDFNIHRISDPAKYKQLDALMTGAQARDSWTWVHGEGAAQESSTDDQVNNTLAQFFSPNRDTPDPDCIDYVYLRNGVSMSLRPISAQVLRDWRYPTGDISPKWYWVHKGTATHLPSAVAFGKKLCVAARGTDGKLQVAVFDQSNGKWIHRTISQGGADLTCDGAPSVVWFYGGLHLFFQQAGQVYKMESADGLTWTPKQSQGSGFRTSGGLCAIVHRGSLLVFGRDPNPRANGVFYHKWTDRWSDRNWIGINTRHDIAAAVLNDRLCVVTRDDDGGSGRTAGVMRALCDETGKWSVAQLANAITTGSPGITASNGKFDVYYREPDGGGIFHRSSKDGIQWTGVDFTGHATTDEVCAVAWEGKILLFFPFVVNGGDHLIYPQRALAHAYHPPGVELDASDHYPYMIELVWAP